MMDTKDELIAELERALGKGSFMVTEPSHCRPRQSPHHDHRPEESMMSDTCILRKSTGPWWDRKRTTETVICGLSIARQYVRQGYQFDWDATTDANRTP